MVMIIKKSEFPLHLKFKNAIQNNMGPAKPVNQMQK